MYRPDYFPLIRKDGNLNQMLAQRSLTYIFNRLGWLFRVGIGLALEPMDCHSFTLEDSPSSATVLWRPRSHWKRPLAWNGACPCIAQQVKAWAFILTTCNRLLARLGESVEKKEGDQMAGTVMTTAGVVAKSGCWFDYQFESSFAHGPDELAPLLLAVLLSWEDTAL